MTESSKTPDSASPTPDSAYRARLEELARDKQRLETSDDRFSSTRMIVFLVFIGVVIVAWRSDSISFWWSATPLGVFIGLVVAHGRVARVLERTDDAIGFYERGLARIGDVWAGSGNTTLEWKADDHLYANDLDLFGHGSLFELMDTTRTQFGASTLARWMCGPAEVAEIEARREGSAELRDRLEFREALGLAGARIDADLHPVRLRSWANATPERLSSGARRTVNVLTGLSLVAFLYMILGGALQYLPLVPLVITNLITMRVLGADTEERMAGVDRAVQDLRLLSLLAECIEKEQFQSERLVAHQQCMTSGERNASAAIHELERLFVALEQMKNQMFAPVVVVTNWPLHVLDRIEAWRERHGSEVTAWVETLGELEALAAIATYAYEHPADAEPELLESREPVVRAKDLGHPLIPAAQMVRNDVLIDNEHALTVVSGSNMSGKSTYLRAIGINVVLALMGAPVRAASMSVTPCALGASIHVEDSIQEGVSHFYAEILRLKAIEELLDGDLPVVFMVDEILHGTNSKDRRAGSEAVMRQFLERGAAGLITTHDLELTRLEMPDASKIRNVHFEDRMRDGELMFDYTLREGVVEKSNALELMRSIGLQIDGDRPNP